MYQNFYYMSVSKNKTASGILSKNLPEEPQNKASFNLNQNLGEETLY